jgi:hypothetical protein
VWLFDASALRVLLPFREQAATAASTFRIVGVGGFVPRVRQIMGANRR